MAQYYVSSVAGNDTDGLTWATAKITIAGGLTLAVANNDIIFVDSAHAGTYGAAQNLDIATAGISVRIISVNRNGLTGTGHAGPLAGAKESLTANATGFTFGSSRDQIPYFFGIRFETSSGNSASNTIVVTSAMTDIVFDNCVLACLGSGSATPGVTFGTNSASNVLMRVKLFDTKIIGPNNTTSIFITLRGADVFASRLSFEFAGANKPTVCIQGGAGYGRLEITNSDLSDYNTTGGAYVNTAVLRAGPVIFKNCVLSSTPSIQTGVWLSNSPYIMLIDVDSGNTRTVFEFRNRLGTITESESIYMNAGATFDTIPISWQIVTTTLCREYEPFITPWIQKYSTSTSQISPKLYLAYDNVTGFTNKHIWNEFECVTGTSAPLGFLTGTRFQDHLIDGTGVVWPTSSAITWNGTGSFTSADMKTIQVNVTPYTGSLLRSRFFIGLSGSYTFYLNPEIVL